MKLSSLKLGDLEPGDVFCIAELRDIFPFWEDGDVFMVTYPGCSVWGAEVVEVVDRFGSDLHLPKTVSVKLSDDESQFCGMQEVIENRKRRARA
jgi:hypothetical protein